MQETNILDRIVKAKRTEIERLKQSMPVSKLLDQLKDLPEGIDFRKAIDGKQCAIIAEVKKHSPSSGSLKENADPCQVAVLYAQNGAAAVSVLTEREFFHGAPEYLTAIKKVIRIPALRKDFIIDPYQIYETRCMGADALLLIAGLLPVGTLREFIHITLSLRMWPLVEVHSRSELEVALAADAEIIGINNRNLKTFTTDINTTSDLLPYVPAGKTLISESGISTRGDIEILMKAGVHAFLVGEALMLAPDPGRKLLELSGMGG